MPYIITTTEPYGEASRALVMEKVGRRAVATIKDAQAYLSGYLEAKLKWPSDPEASREAGSQLWWGLKEVGGSVGPLPDGTTVDVVPVPLTRIFDELRHAMALPSDVATEQQIIDAYNAAQEDDCV